MVSKARKNRPKKKEIPQDKWDEQFQNLQGQYQYGGERHGEKDEDTKKER